MRRPAPARAARGSRRAPRAGARRARRTRPAWPARGRGGCRSRSGRPRRGRRRRCRAARRRSRRGRRSSRPPRAAAASRSTPVMPPQRRDLQAHRVGRAGPGGALLGGGLVHRERHVDLGAHRAQRLDAVDRLLGAARSPTGASARRCAIASSTRPRRRWRRPGSPRRGPTAARTAASRPASSPIPTLTLTCRTAPAHGGGRRGGGAGAVLGADRRVDGDRARGLDRDQLAPPARPARLPAQVPQREVDRGQRLRQVALGPARLEQLGGVRASRPSTAA